MVTTESCKLLGKLWRIQNPFRGTNWFSSTEPLCRRLNAYHDTQHKDWKKAARGSGPYCRFTQAHSSTTRRRFGGHLTHLQCIRLMNLAVNWSYGVNMSLVIPVHCMDENSVNICVSMSEIASTTLGKQAACKKQTQHMTSGRCIFWRILWTAYNMSYKLVQLWSV